jgi:DNA-binding beta-propeller fold protein YncE
MWSPGGVTVHAATGNVFISDTGNHKVMMVNVTSGIISNVAGTGISGFAGDGGAAVSAQLSFPRGLVVDEALQRLYVADNANNRVRVIDLASGVITTVVGTGAAVSSGDGGAPIAAGLQGPWDVELDPASGHLYIAERAGQRIRKVVL